MLVEQFPEEEVHVRQLISSQVFSVTEELFELRTTLLKKLSHVLFLQNSLPRASFSSIATRGRGFLFGVGSRRGSVFYTSMFSDINRLLAIPVTVTLMFS